MSKYLVQATDYKPRTPTEKTCILCLTTKPAAEFLLHPYITTQGKRGVRLESRCNDCIKERQRERWKIWAKKYPEKAKIVKQRYAQKPEARQRKRVWRRDRHLHLAYGWTQEQYEAEYREQEGRCLICGQEFAVLCIDHCHATNKFRGLLCNGCNRGIGALQDNATLCQKAAEYLKCRSI